MTHRRTATLSLLLAVACAPAPEAEAVRSTADSLAVAAGDSAARARQDAVNRAQPGYIVDSILPVEEEMRRFRAAVGGREATSLSDGARTRDELAARFARALAARDSAALRRLAVTPREFIDLIYPASPYTQPPYRQSPGLLWSQIQLPSRTGYGRLLERHGGRPLRILALSCPGTPERQGENRLHTQCAVRFTADGGPPRDGILFGTILERRGAFKFVSFANMY